MKQNSQPGAKKTKYCYPKSKSQKKCQLITRGQSKQIPTVKRRAVSLYKIDCMKEYLMPIDPEQNNFQFWGCATPPKKIKVKNPFIKEQTPKNKPYTTSPQTSTTLLARYLTRKSTQTTRTITIAPTLTDPTRKPDPKTFTTFNSSCSKQLDRMFFMSTMVSEHDSMVTETYGSEFGKARDRHYLEKMGQLKEKITARDQVLKQIKENMNTIRFKKMSLFFSG